METKTLEKFAQEARTQLLRQVAARLDIVLDLNSRERREAPAEVTRIEQTIAAGSRAGLIDKVAYTWFNRIIALRFMDAKHYNKVKIVSPGPGTTGQPEVLAEAKAGNVAPVLGNRTDRVMGLLTGQISSPDAQQEAYRILLTGHCNALSKQLPFMFETIDDYTELLLPSDLLSENSITARAAAVLTEAVCADVEVIGWLYQFYISERKDEVFAGFKKNMKAGAAEIPAATQLFTPHWIVRYLVENSLGRLWLLNRPSSRLAEHMDYYIAPVDEQTQFLRVEGPEELTVIDPACGSGHMLTYAFDLLYAIYAEEGYAPSEIPGLILTKNLFGVEIDPRAGALAAFALTMKAQGRQRAFFSKGVSPNICVLDPISFTEGDLDLLVTPGGDRGEEEAFWNQFQEADTFGSLLRPAQLASDGASGLRAGVEAETLEGASVNERANVVVEQVRFLASPYKVVIANPPYLGTRHMADRLREFATTHYAMAKGDLCTMFLERSLELLVDGGFAALVTSESWFFNTSFEDTRRMTARSSALRLAVCIDSLAFGVRLNTVASVMEKGGIDGLATFTRVNADSIRKGVDGLPIQDEAVFRVALSRFDRIPGGVFAFDMPDSLLALYEHGRVLGEVIETRQGMATTDNGRFVRLWCEVSASDIGWNHYRGAPGNPAWVPYNKGGTPKRWWGNQLHVVRWKDEARELLEIGAKSVNQEKFFEPSISWSNIGKGGAQFRTYPQGFVFDVAGMSAFAPTDALRLNLLGYLNSRVITLGLDVLAPTLNYQVGDVARLPVPDLAHGSDQGRVQELVDLAREEWSELETSHVFAMSPYLREGTGALEGHFSSVRSRQTARAAEISSLERSSNKYWSNVIEQATGIQVPLEPANSEMTPESAKDGITDLISYAVGCIFGRYSLDEPGLILANQGDTLADYLAKVPNPTFIPDADNVIPIVDGDWFEDDIVARFREFLRAAFGEEHFEENLRFVNESLGVKDGRAYLLKSFYADHLKRYKKRPIYWLFSSPKGSFNALIYMHRYQRDTVSVVLSEYLQPFRAKLEAHMRVVNETQVSATASTVEKTRARREAEDLRKTIVELSDYERDIVHPLATRQIAIVLDDGVKANYPIFGAALKRIPGLDKHD